MNGFEKEEKNKIKQRYLILKRSVSEDLRKFFDKPYTWSSFNTTLEIQSIGKVSKKEWSNAANKIQEKTLLLYLKPINKY